MKGKGFSMQLRGCQVKIADNPGAMRQFIDQCIEMIDMNPISDFMEAKGMDDMPGYSVGRIIETSHIFLHGFEINSVYMFSVESCKDFDENELKWFIVNFFMPNDYSLTIYPIESIVPVTKSELSYDDSFK